MGVNPTLSRKFFCERSNNYNYYLADVLTQEFLDCSLFRLPKDCVAILTFVLDTDKFSCSLVRDQDLCVPRAIHGFS